jgi:serine-type D-Ala-D-Ala carboxypeptidase/endopeptidase
MNRHLRILGTVLLIVIAQIVVAAADDYSDSLQLFLHQNFDHSNAGMVVGIVDANGSHVFSAGKLGNGTDQQVDGDTVFEIGSVTKTFTALLLEDMVARGEMKMDDPVAKYLPDTVQVPTHGGREITLSNLAAQDSGLPFNPDNYAGYNWPERFRTYTAPKMYDFLAHYQLTQNPGEKYQYSNLGMGLLGHAIERRTGQDFESLVIQRICHPLQMDSTCVSLTPELKARFATGHDLAGNVTENLEFSALAGAGALKSSVNDLLKLAAAEAGSTTSPLGVLMEDTHVIRHTDGKVRDENEGCTAMPWFDEGVYTPPDSQFLGHSGGTDGQNSFVGFDLKQRVGIVVLSNQKKISSSMLGWRILQRAHLDGLDPERVRPIRDSVGIGAILDLDQNSHVLKIKGVIANSPAEKAGLVAGMVVRSIDGEAIGGKSLADCLGLFRGPAGSTIRLDLIDAAGNAQTIALKREKYRMDA